ncbi:MAG: CheD [Ramlibacter sp.]|jgi:chemotaxis protein CheD|nr:CheD [Ramlibacter sp.]
MEGTAPVRYFDRDFQVESVKILPGQYYAASGQGAITTVLGSCVSTCLWDPVMRIGGMNHFMLPGDGESASLPVTASARFGVYAMEVLINEMIRLGADRRRMVSKVFGGGRVLQGFGSLDVGAKNCEFVLEFLATEGIPVVARDLLDVYARKLHFFPGTGKVQLKKLHILPNDTVQLREREYIDKLGATRSGGGEFDNFSAPG